MNNFLNTEFELEGLKKKREKGGSGKKRKGKKEGIGLYLTASSQRARRWWENLE